MYDMFLFQAQQILKCHLRCIDESFAGKTPGDKNVWDICDYQTVHMSNLTRHHKQTGVRLTRHTCSISCAACVARFTNPVMVYPFTQKIFMKILSSMNTQCVISNCTPSGIIRAMLPSTTLF